MLFLAVCGACQFLPVSGGVRRSPKVWRANKECDSSLLPPRNPHPAVKSWILQGKGGSIQDLRPLESVMSWVTLIQQGMAALCWVGILTAPPVLAPWPLVIFGLGLLYLKCFVPLPPTSWLKVLTSELQDTLQIIKVSGMFGVCILYQKSTKCFISVIWLEWI